MGLQRNISDQYWIVFAFNRTDNVPKTGDANNITANLRIDGGGANAIDDTNPDELEDGFYMFGLTDTETNGNLIVICPASVTGDIQVIGCPMATWTDALLVDSVWDEKLTGATHNVATSAGRRLRAAGHDVSITRENTCQAGEDSSHIKLDTGASGTDGFYDHMWIYLTSGTGAGQVRLIDDYVGSTFVAEIHPAWLTNPDETTEYTIIARAPTFTHDIEAEGLASINAEVDRALNTAIPGSPTANSINERIKAIITALGTVQADLDNPDQYKSTEHTKL